MKLHTTAEVAAILRESPWATRRRIARGEVRARKVGRQYLVEDDDLQAFLARKVHVPDTRKRRAR